MLEKHFRTVIEEVRAWIAVNNRETLLAIETFVSNVWEKRDFVATLFKQGVMVVEVVPRLPDEFVEAFRNYREHRLVVYTSRRIKKI